MTTAKFNSILFDFDGTLSTIDGIEFLAELKGVSEKVKSLAIRNKNTYSVSADLYRRRLECSQPHLRDIDQLIAAYKRALLPGVKQTFHWLHGLNKDIYIISGGIKNALIPVGELLGVSAERIFAVELEFDGQGNMIGFDSTSPRTDVGGKKQLIASLRLQRPSVLIGDGTNDVAARDSVDQCIGFGGVEYRPLIEEHCEWYVRDPAIITVLPAILTQEELSEVRKNWINQLSQKNAKTQEVLF